MKKIALFGGKFRVIIGLFALFATGIIAHGQSIPFVVSFYYPTNGQSFAAGANIPFYLRVADSNVVRTIQYFSGSTLLRTTTNTGNVLLTNSTAATSIFSLVWSNVPAGNYSLTAVGTDAAGLTATSSPVKISVTNVIAPNVPFLVSFWYPTNGQHFVAPAVVGLHALALDSNVVRTVQYFSGTTAIGIVTNAGNVPFTNSTQGNPFFLAWSNVPAGNYSLSAVATDVAGLSATSAPVNIIVTNPVPICYIYSPTNNSVLLGPLNVPIYARAVEPGGTVASVQYYANSLFLGSVPATQQAVFTNVSIEPLIPFIWTNAPPGTYTLKVVATDTLGASSTSSVVNISIVTNLPPARPFVAIYSPTNGTKFIAPTNFNLYARAYEGSTGTVVSVEFFANSTSLGVVSNSSQTVYSNISSAPLFSLTWPNAPVGSYYLKAVATDAAGLTATSSLVSISVITNSPPPNIPFLATLTNPTNSQQFSSPATVLLRAVVTDSNLVKQAQFFAGTTSLGVVSNTSTALPSNPTAGTLFYFTWSNAPAGIYPLTVVALDSAGNTVTSAPVNIIVTNIPPPNVPFLVSFWYPTNGQVLSAPANVGLHARVTDSNVVQTVQYFYGTTSIGTVTNTGSVLFTNSTQANPFFLAWSNVPAGIYSLTALATDSAGNTAVSAPVTIYVVTNVPVVTIYAPDPVAIEGTNYLHWNATGPITNYINGTNTATFLVRRDSATNTDLTVTYDISGSAISGIDYEAIPDYVTIPAGQRYALITIVPLDDSDSDYRHYDNVVLTLTPPTNAPPAYLLGSPRSAGAVILEEDYLPMTQPVIHNLVDSSIHLSLPATNGMNYCLQVSTDMMNWVSISTNTVIKSSAQFVDTGNSGNPGQFYRIVPIAATPAF
jgi:hypothetical protein